MGRFCTFFIVQEIVKIFLFFKSFTAENAEIAESNHSKDKIQERPVLFYVFPF